MEIPYTYIECINIPDVLAGWTDHPGDCYEDLLRLMQVDEIKDELDKINAENLKLELKEYGAWTDKELNNHNDNLVRILWITCCNINERNA